MRFSAPIIVCFVLIAFVGVTFSAGCGKNKTTKVASSEKAKVKKKKKPKPDDDDDVLVKPAAAPKLAGRPVNSPPASGQRFGGGAPFASGSLATARSQSENLSSETAADRVGWEIVDALEDRPTLAIWLFDRTSSASAMRTAVSRRLEEILQGFDQMKKKGHKAFANEENGPPLLTVIAAFGKTCQIMNEEPTDDPAAISSALTGITEESDGQENTFAAVQQVLQEYLKYRTEKHRLVMVTIVTDEAGDDGEKVNELVPVMEKYAIPTYVIGVQAPLGRSGTMAGDGAMEGGRPLHVGPESFAKEMIDLDFKNVDRKSDVMESGFGTFSLSRLAKLSGGSYLIVRNQGGMFGGGGRRFESRIMAKYAPDYVSKEDYEKLLAENKCRMALHNAALLDPVDINNNSVNLQLVFVKMDEAKLKVACDKAQQAMAAALDRKLGPLFKAMTTASESDRAKLTGLRWQAEYDLAAGRVYAAQAHLEGYNTMVAQIKQGKRPGGPNDSQWILTPKDSFSTDSRLEKMVKTSRKYLERVVKEHPGTPWEVMATRELQSPCGWEWTAR